jgi:hypothetical protein
LDFADLGFGPLDASGLGFDTFVVDDLAFGIALVRRGAGARFAAFRPRLAMFPPVEP